jgi:hypothetical protein
MEQWRVRIREKRREPINLDMVVQAVVAFGRQLWEGQDGQQSGACTSSERDITGRQRDEP